eukprot:2525172-Prymnesium_polylepis.1
MCDATCALAAARSLYEIADDAASCGQSTLDCKYVSYAKAFQKSLKDGTCSAQGYTVAGSTKTISVPFLGDITITTYTKPALAVSAPESSCEYAFSGISPLPACAQRTAPRRQSSLKRAHATARSLYEIADDAASCGQSTLDCKYASYAKAFQKGLKDGTCSTQGYTVAGSTKTISVPFLGDITITTYTKPALVARAHNTTTITTTSGCATADLSQICQSFDHLQGDVQGCAIKCILSGTSCMNSCVKGLGFSDTCAGCCAPRQAHPIVRGRASLAER